MIDPGREHVGTERKVEGPLSFFFSSDADDSAPCDLVVLPAGLLLARTFNLHSDAPRIAYGPVDLMADAFAEGCSDYLREPWDLEELEARALRFQTWKFRLGDQDLSYSTGRLTGPAGSRILPEGERRVMELLLQRLGKPVPRRAFLRALGAESRPGSRKLDMSVCRLRFGLAQTAGNSQAGSLLSAVRNYGYRLDGTPCA